MKSKFGIYFKKLKVVLFPSDFRIIVPDSSVRRILVPNCSNLPMISGEGCPYLLSLPTEIRAYVGDTVFKNSSLVEYLEP